MSSDCAHPLNVIALKYIWEAGQQLELGSADCCMNWSTGLHSCCIAWIHIMFTCMKAFGLAKGLPVTMNMTCLALGPGAPIQALEFAAA